MTNGSGIPPTQSAPTPISKDGGQVVQIKSLPDALQSISRAVRLEGEVVRQNSDGTTRIQTPQGPVDITIRGKQPQPGQRVEIELPAGSPPKTATLRVINAPPAPPPTQPGTPLPARISQTPQAPPAPKPSQISSTGGIEKTIMDGITKPLSTPLPSIIKPPLLPLTTSQSTPQGVIQPAPLLIGQSIRIVSPPPASQSMPAPSLAVPDLETALMIKIPSLPPILPAASAFATLSSRITALPQTITKNFILSTPAFGSIKPNPFFMMVSPLTPPSSPAPIMGEIKMAGLKSPMGLFSFITPKPNPHLLSLPALTTQSIIKPPSVVDAKITAIQNTIILFTDGAKKNASLTTPFSAPAMGGIITLPHKAGQIPAMITGFTPNSIPILTLGGSLSGGMAGSMVGALQFPATNIAEGTQLILTPINSSIGQGFKPILTSMQPLPFWPVMDDALQSLYQLNPALADMFSKTLPNPGAGARGQMGAAIILLMAAIRAGDLQGWMGDKRLEALQRAGKSDMLTRLSSDINASTTRTSDGAGGEWRSYPLPLLWQNEIAKVMFHVHHDASTEDKTDQDSATRFILDLSLTHMGDVQIDGLLRGARLDLILRTQKQISYPMQQAMKTAYTNALESTRIYGDIAFQSDIKTWVQVIRREENSLGVSA